MKRIDFQPVLFDTLKNYSKEKFFTDLMAGIIVGIVALPLAIAFGIASGVSPEQGLITAIIAGFPSWEGVTYRSEDRLGPLSLSFMVLFNNSVSRVWRSLPLWPESCWS